MTPLDTSRRSLNYLIIMYLLALCQVADAFVPQPSRKCESQHNHNQHQHRHQHRHQQGRVHPRQNNRSPQMSPLVPMSLSRQSPTRLWAIPVLDKWKVMSNGSIVGTVRNHPSIDDGDVITTSPIQDPDTAKAQGIIETASGSKYRLLSPLMYNSGSGGGGNWAALNAYSAAVAARTGTSSQQQQAAASAAPSNNNNFNAGFSFPGFSSSDAKAAAIGDAGSTPSTTDTTDTNSNPTLKKARLRSGPEWREAVLQYKLTQSTVGLDEEYLLAGKPERSTSGKSNIWEAYRADETTGLPVQGGGEASPVCIKVSTNLEAVSREYENYRKLSFLGIARGRFVKCYEFFPVAGYDKRFRNQCALVLEKGSRDLKSYLNSRGRLEGQELRDACISAAQCVQALHSAGLVWTDLKTENFVVMPDGEVKGIDLESAMPVGDNPVDYSPEACPPEFAEAFLEGDGQYFLLESSYDIWSLGMLMLELSSGRGYFDGKNPTQITKMLRESQEGISVDDEEDIDDRLKDLLRRCLQRDPKKRPNMAQILLHPYFLTSPFSILRNFS